MIPVRAYEFDLNQGSLVAWGRETQIMGLLMWRNCNNIHLHSLEGRVSPACLPALYCAVAFQCPWRGLLPAS